MKPITAQRVRDQIVAAFTGGSNCWLFTAKLLRADNKPTVTPWFSDAKVFERRFAIELGYDDPAGWEGQGQGRARITHVDVRRALRIMRREYPKRFANVMNGTGDGDTADLFIQLALFGKAVYGAEAPDVFVKPAWYDALVAKVLEERARG
jgi:hypothetical protein